MQTFDSARPRSLRAGAESRPLSAEAVSCKANIAPGHGVARGRGNSTGSERGRAPIWHQTVSKMTRRSPIHATAHAGKVPTGRPRPIGLD
jgi:hypothetical protein